MTAANRALARGLLDAALRLDAGAAAAGAPLVGSIAGLREKGLPTR